MVLLTTRRRLLRRRWPARPTTRACSRCSSARSWRPAARWRSTSTGSATWTRGWSAPGRGRCPTGAWRRCEAPPSARADDGRRAWLVLALGAGRLAPLVTAATFVLYLVRLHAAQALSAALHAAWARSPARCRRSRAGRPPATTSASAPGCCSAILFLWQLPHTLAIARLYQDDYARAGVRVLPVIDARRRLDRAADPERLSGAAGGEPAADADRPGRRRLLRRRAPARRHLRWRSAGSRRWRPRCCARAPRAARLRRSTCRLLLALWPSTRWYMPQRAWMAGPRCEPAIAGPAHHPDCLVASSCSRRPRGLAAELQARHDGARHRRSGPARRAARRRSAIGCRRAAGRPRGDGDGEPPAARSGPRSTMSGWRCCSSCRPRRCSSARLVSRFFVLRLAAPQWPPPLQPRLPIGLTGLNTFVLLASSCDARAGAARRSAAGDRARARARARLDLGRWAALFLARAGLRVGAAHPLRAARLLGRSTARRSTR